MGSIVRAQTVFARVRSLSAAAAAVGSSQCLAVGLFAIMVTYLCPCMGAHTLFPGCFNTFTRKAPSLPAHPVLGSLLKKTAPTRIFLNYS